MDPEDLSTEALARCLTDAGVSAAGHEPVCRRFRIREVAIFGSFVRDDFGPARDVGLLLTRNAPLSFAEYFDLLDAMTALFGREVDLVLAHELAEDFDNARRREIPGSARPVYAAA